MGFANSHPCTYRGSRLRARCLFACYPTYVCRTAGGLPAGFPTTTVAAPLLQTVHVVSRDLGKRGVSGYRCNVNKAIPPLVWSGTTHLTQNPWSDGTHHCACLFAGRRDGRSPEHNTWEGWVMKMELLRLSRYAMMLHMAYQPAANHHGLDQAIEEGSK